MQLLASLLPSQLSKPVRGRRAERQQNDSRTCAAVTYLRSAQKQKLAESGKPGLLQQSPSVKNDHHNANVSVDLTDEAPLFLIKSAMQVVSPFPRLFHKLIWEMSPLIKTRNNLRY